MPEAATFVTAVYVVVDDFCKEHLPAERVKPGPRAALSRSEVMTLSIIGQWSRFRSERDFYRYADQQLRWAFPRLPNYSQYNRHARQYTCELILLGQHLCRLLGAQQSVYEAIDCTAIAVRDSHRRGNGWLCGLVDIGHSNRIGWFEGLRLLTSVTSDGVITGYCVAPASTNDRHLAEALLAARAQSGTDTPSQQLPCCGCRADGTYVADMGFAGQKWQPHWRNEYGAAVIARGQKEQWPKQQRRWLAHTRQIVETVFDKLHNYFSLKHERPHQLDGFQMRMAARVTLHNFCIWFNRLLGRPLLAFADLLGWA